VEFRLEVELGAMPYAFFKAVEDTVRETLGQSHAHQGLNKSMSSTGADFRG
jgi:ribosomal protection tetracycline resistance protein